MVLSLTFSFLSHFFSPSLSFFFYFTRFSQSLLLLRFLLSIYSSLFLFLTHSPQDSGSVTIEYKWKYDTLIIPRGTIQTILLHRPFDEIRRLGIQRDTEDFFRSKYPDIIGLLVVDQVIKNGPADGTLRPGDIVLRCNGTPIVTFIDIEDILDSSVGHDVTIEVERAGQPLSLTLRVQDLHSVTPSSFFQVSRAVFHSTSYQLARHYNVPVGGAYLASAGDSLLSFSLSSSLSPLLP